MKQWAVLAVCLLALPAIGADAISAPPPSTSGGRYQIVMSNIGAQWTFMVDTQTGRAWQLTKGDAENSVAAWSEMKRYDLSK